MDKEHSGINKYSRGHIGKEVITNQGLKSIAIDGGTKPGYIKIKIYGTLKPYITEVQTSNFLNGSVTNHNLKNKYSRMHIGEIHFMDDMKVEVMDGGLNCGCCIVKLYTKNRTYCKEVEYKTVKHKNIYNKYKHRVSGVGYLGEGVHKSSINKNHTKKYLVWSRMMHRCYDAYGLNKLHSYRNTFVCKEWHNFQVFGDWFDENYQEFDNFRTELDKDIIGDGKLYSPDTCCFVPSILNSFVTSNTENKNAGLEGVGLVRLETEDDKYIARIYDFFNSERKYLGYFDNKYEAHEAYINAKREKIKILKEKCINDWNIKDKRILDNIK